MQRDAELFLGWAADAFVAAGRADEPEQRRNHRRRAELFCDIFHELNRSADPRGAADDRRRDAVAARALAPKHKAP